MKINSACYLIFKSLSFISNSIDVGLSKRFLGGPGLINMLSQLFKKNYYSDCIW